ncbi:hypothetical protein [Marinobacter sp. OP 3.4]|uniref:hypothetical protein n=1 Tax=Marinobacter sp. OP 3.4 TaxID=3076501 RepID=UPI002E1B3DAE
MSTLNELESAWSEEATAKAERFYQSKFGRRQRWLLGLIENHRVHMYRYAETVCYQNRVAKRLNALSAKAVSKRLAAMIEREAK